MTCPRCHGKREVILYREHPFPETTVAVWAPCPECKLSVNREADVENGRPFVGRRLPTFGSH